MRKILAAVFCFCLFSALAAAQTPKTVLHIIHIKWKEDATPEQIKAAVDAVRELPSKYPGIKRVWTRDLKVQAQEGFTEVIVMEFESEDALKKYAGSAAQQAWYKVYLPVREESRTDDVGN